MAGLNGVVQWLVPSTWCDAGYLSQLRDKRCFVLCDCEGYEFTLFDLQAVNGLNRSDVLIELHDVNGVDAAIEMARRFALTHRVSFIAQVARVPQDYAELDFLGKDAMKALVEYRNPGQRWAWMQSRKTE